MAGATPGLVPVAKGNGYGYGLVRLAEEAAELGVDTLAVGTLDEAAMVRDTFAGDIVVMTPLRRNDTRAMQLAGDPRVISTVSRVEDLVALTQLTDPPRVLFEVLTSMRRYGTAPDHLSRCSTTCSSRAGPSTCP